MYIKLLLNIATRIIFKEVEDTAIDTTVALCGVHIELKVVVNYSAKIVNGTFGIIAKADISMLRNDTGSQIQFKQLSKLVVEEWKRLGEHAFAKTFQQEYLTAPFDVWSINALPS